MPFTEIFSIQRGTYQQYDHQALDNACAAVKKLLKRRTNQMEARQKNCKSNKKQFNNEQQPGPSKENTKIVNFDNCDILDEDVSIRDEEKCCVCGNFEPKALRDKPDIEFVKWAQCVVCCHWVHLSYCVPEIVVRKDTKVVCPHCKQQ